MVYYGSRIGCSKRAGVKIYQPADRKLGFLHWSANYSVQKENKTTIGGVLKADFNWAFLPFAGLGAGVYANFNSIQSPVGFEIKLLIGKMNTKRKP